MSQGKRTLPVFRIASGADLSTNYTSTPTVIASIDRVFLVISVTGTPTGTLTVQASVDYDRDLGTAGNWFDMPLSLDALAGAAQDYVIDIQETAIKAIRLNYASTAGVGAMTATIFGKES